MYAIGRRHLLGVAAMAMLAACNNSNGQTAAAASDMSIGAANAPASLIEYASSTCSHCAEFHADVWPELKRNYIDTGKVRFTFREFPTPPANVSVAGFQLARCNNATPDQYLTRVGVLFEQQRAIFASGSMEGVRQKFIEIGAAAGLTQEQVMACITDPAGAERVRHTVEDADRLFHISGTPTLILNGQKIEDRAAYTYAGLSGILDTAIAGD